MKKLILLCGALLALDVTVAAAAQGLNLRWQACIGDGGAFNRAFACDSNTAPSHVLVGGFELGLDMANVSGDEIVIDLSTADFYIQPWWQFRNAGSCRLASLALNTTISPAAVACADWGNGLSVGGVGAYILGGANSFPYLWLGGANTARIVAATAVPYDALSQLFAGQEYFSFNVVIDNAKTVGTGACLGCQSPACITFNSLHLTTPVAANDRKLTGPANLTDGNFVTWQGGGGVWSERGDGCPAATPTRKQTWGAVKSLYR